MSTVQGGQGNIVTNGLVLNLDAANPRSYPQPYNGTTWIDLSGNENNGTLINGVAYTGSNGGSLVFDGTDDYAQTVSILTGSSYTSEFFFNANSVPLTVEKWLGSQYTGGANRIIFDIYTDNRLRNFMGGGTNPISTSVFSTTVVQPNTWYHAVFSKDTLGTGSLYVNGILEGRGAMSLGVPENVAFQIGGDTTLSNRWFNGRIPITRLYNKILTPSEVLQNFNATRARFGI